MIGVKRLLMKYTDKVNRHQKTKSKIIKIVVIIVVISLAYLAYHLIANRVSKSNGSLSATTTTAPKQMAAAESGLLPWSISAPLSRMNVYPGPGSNQLVLAGGLTSGNQSGNGIFTLNTTNGNLNMTGTVATAFHDASGEVINGSYAIFGGGNSSSFNSASLVTLSGKVIKSSHLPQARSDSSSLTVNGNTYIIGGYNGNNADPDVLMTNNGTSFASIGKLPVPVRYAAVASEGQYIYVFGGQAIGGSQNGKPVRDVQIINTATRSITLANWQLPVPLEGAIAFNIKGELFLAGGQSSTTEKITPGVGTTQVPGVNVLQNSPTFNTIWAVDTANGKFLKAGTLQLPVSNAGVAVVGNYAWIVGGEYNTQPVSSVQMVTPNIKFGIAGQPGAGSPYYGSKLMIADRGNNQILVMNSSMNVTWKYPSSSTSPAASSGFYFPDDAFFANHGTTIISNQENNNTIIQLSYPAGKIIWKFGHPLQAGSAYGYLRAPDDAYLLKNNDVIVADDQNCRVLFINPAGKVVGQIGETGVCVHNPGVSLGSPNGDTPLLDGNVLISEILGSWVSEYTPQGKLVWTTHLPISYPSDPQQIGARPGYNPNNYLIADYSDPGAIVRFTRQGKVLYRYQVTSGPGMLNDPSLVELLPSGAFMLNDDHRDRMVSIDPTTKALVWQYGISDQPGKGVGMLHKPDGFDILLPNGTTPTHPATK